MVIFIFIESGECAQYFNIPLYTILLALHKNLLSGQPVQLEDGQIFTKDSLIARSVIRNRLLNTGVILYECAKWALRNEWRGKEIVLQLEHINGISNDHRLENLRFLCPNCHAQTETWKGRNKKQNLSG